MARYLIDTDAFVDYLNVRPPAVSLFVELAEAGDTLCLCDVVVAEVYSGLGAVPDPRAEGLIQSAEFVLTSMDTARQAGTWRHDYARQGIQLSTTDTLVAAVALQIGATLITASLNDYPIPEISVLRLPR
jgi:predicted nucleic acid-binding protein